MVRLLKLVGKMVEYVRIMSKRLYVCWREPGIVCCENDVDKGCIFNGHTSERARDRLLYYADKFVYKQSQS